MELISEDYNSGAVELKPAYLHASARVPHRDYRILQSSQHILYFLGLHEVWSPLTA
jgi:hypothetical protein